MLDFNICTNYNFSGLTFKKKAIKLSYSMDLATKIDCVWNI